MQPAPEHSPRARRTALTWLLRQSASLALVGADSVRAATPVKKISKSEAAYQDGPSATGERCAMCTYYEQPSACQVVDGEVKADAWCRLFEAGM
jgi:hypothetical protein